VPVTAQDVALAIYRQRGSDRTHARARAEAASTRYPHIARCLGSLPPTPLEIGAIRVGLVTWVGAATEDDGLLWQPFGQQTL